jgi:plasmid replication initiation protein
MGRIVTDVGLEKQESKRELKKHAATIHCSNSLSLLQRKVSNALLYHAYKEMMVKEEHEITVKQLCRLIGYQGNNHAVIKDALKELISTVIEWNVINDVTGNENWTASSILASVSLEGPLCFYAYSPRMKQLLHSPSMFGKIDLVIQSRFRSSYGLALYENCIRYRGLPNTKWFELDLFKKLMGVPPGIYDVFRDFKRRVLDKAIDEVNMYSDLVVEADYVREGRKVARVRFKLKDRAKKMRLGSHGRKVEIGAVDEIESLKLALIEQFGLSPGQVEQVVAEYDAGFIKDKIKLIETSRPYKEGKVQNLAAYLISALKNNYQAVKPKQNEVINIHDVKLEIEFADIKRQIEDMRQRYQHYREEEIYQAIANLLPAQKKTLMDDFTAFAEPAVNMIMKLQASKYSRENVYESPQLKSLLRRFALRELDFITLITFDEYAAQQGEQEREALQKLKSFDPDHPLLRLNE